ncbi:small integral membrane protein 4 [Colletes gigas]|uniref:small integral membrane protein 4 n=1 Tax=Colletes gigas TaxID=935657 RepID=UPI001C9B3A0C|nr:small integral membrane protein 4 [Colletes gigas]
MLSTLRYNVRRTLRICYHKLPGKALQEFRLLPLFFLMGAGLEYTMIHWHVGEVNFYNTYKKRKVEEALEERLREMGTKSV